MKNKELENQSYEIETETPKVIQKLVKRIDQLEELVGILQEENKNLREVNYMKITTQDYNE